MQIEVGYAMFLTAIIGLGIIAIFLLAYRFLRRTRAYAVAFAAAVIIWILEAIFIKPTNVVNLNIESTFWQNSFYFIWTILWTFLPVTIYAAVNFLVRILLPKKYFQPKEKKEKATQFKLREIR